MNCTVCGKPHSKEHPLTIIEDMVPIGQVIAFCPSCLKELDKPTDAPLYGESPINVATRFVTTGTIRVGDVELPIESFEMR